MTSKSQHKYKSQNTALTHTGSQCSLPLLRAEERSNYACGARDGEDEEEEEEDEGRGWWETRSGPTALTLMSRGPNFLSSLQSCSNAYV